MTIMPETTTRRPSWLTEPCPAWCTAHHREGDHLDDRGHHDTFIDLPHSLEPGSWHKGDWESDAVFVGLQQGWRESAPRIDVNIGDEVQVSFTPAEAQALGERLLTLVQGALR